MLLLVCAFACGSSAGQWLPAHEIVANNPLKSRVISSNLNGILSFGFTSVRRLMCNRSDGGGLHRGKHLPLSHINRVVLIWRRGLFLALLMLARLGRSERLPVIRPNDVIAEIA